MFKHRKSPQEKKRLALKRDCRSNYGENDKATRKLIPLRKAQSHRKIRRNCRQLSKEWARFDDEMADLIESTLTTKALQKPAWKKEPDTTLGEKLERRRRFNHLKPD